MTLYASSVKPLSFQSHLTFVSNLVQLNGHPPFGGAVGATVLLAGVEPGRLQMDRCSWPQLIVVHKPVKSVDVTVNCHWLCFHSFSQMWLHAHFGFTHPCNMPLQHSLHQCYWYLVRFHPTFVSPAWCHPSTFKKKWSLLYYWTCYNTLHTACLHSLEFIEYRAIKQRSHYLCAMSQL